MLTRSKTNAYTEFHMLPYYGRVLSVLRRRNRHSRIRAAIEPHWISPTSIFNYMNNDTLSDYFAESNRFTKQNNLFLNLLSKQGKRFEKLIISDLRDTTGLYIPSVSSIVNEDTVKQTFKYMKEGHPLIHSAPLMNYENNTCGVADLLIRSDCIDKFFGTQYLTQKERHLPSSKISNQWHYLVIDIKFTTLLLSSDGIHLQNTASFRYAKSQVYIYTQALGLLQGYTPTVAFILGRRYKYTKNGETYIGVKYNQKLGMIDITNRDAWLKEEVQKAIEWKRECKKNHDTWSLTPRPSVVQLLPNMCNQKSSFQAEKKEFAHYLNDITQVWQCSPKHRELLEKHGITSLTDGRCTAELLGFKNNRARIVDAILNTQRQEYPIRPEFVPDVPPKTKREYFVDFETIPEVLTDKLDSSICNRVSFIFLIGVGHRNSIGEWVYKSFTMRELTMSEELRVMKEFLEYIGNNCVLYHWCKAETQFWNSALSRHRGQDVKKQTLNWYDLAELFMETPITIKGCLNFSLKNVAKAMYKHNMIQTNWSSDVSNGLECAAEAMVMYNKKDSRDFSDIIKYNEIDCQVLVEILEYLRNKNSNNMFLL